MSLSHPWLSDLFPKTFLHFFSSRTQLVFLLSLNLLFLYISHLGLSHCFPPQFWRAIISRVGSRCVILSPYLLTFRRRVGGIGKKYTVFTVQVLSQKWRSFENWCICVWYAAVKHLLPKYAAHKTPGRYSSVLERLLPAVQHVHTPQLCNATILLTFFSHCFLFPLKCTTGNGGNIFSNIPSGGFVCFNIIYTNTTGGLRASLSEISRISINETLLLESYDIFTIKTT